MRFEAGNRVRLVSNVRELMSKYNYVNKNMVDSSIGKIMIVTRRDGDSRVYLDDAYVWPVEMLELEMENPIIKEQNDQYNRLYSQATKFIKALDAKGYSVTIMNKFTPGKLYYKAVENGLKLEISNRSSGLMVEAVISLADQLQIVITRTESVFDDEDMINRAVDVITRVWSENMDEASKKNFVVYAGSAEGEDGFYYAAVVYSNSYPVFRSFGPVKFKDGEEANKEYVCMAAVKRALSWITQKGSDLSAMVYINEPINNFVVHGKQTESRYYNSYVEFMDSLKGIVVQFKRIIGQSREWKTVLGLIEQAKERSVAKAS